MASYINTNIASLNAQRNLASSQSSLQTSLQRLSSGLRINSAKDDAAGLAISQRMTTQINGLDQAQRNANDGISLAQTADGALSSVSDNLQRIRELAVQAANSTNSDSDRAAIDQEVQQRLAEIDRTTSQTSFNGQKILDGSFGKAQFQVGANAGETISVDLSTSMRAGSIGSAAKAQSADLSSLFTSGAGLTLASGDLTIGGQNITGTFTDATSLKAAIDAKGISGLTTTVSSGELSFSNSSGSAIAIGGTKASTVIGAASTVAAATAGSTTNGTASTSGLGAGITASANAITLNTGDLTLDGTSVTGTYKDATELAAAINSVSSGLATVNSGNLVLTNTSGADIVVGGAVATRLGVNGTAQDGGAAVTSSSTVASDITAHADTIELSAGDLTVGGTNVTGNFKDAASLKARIDALSVSGLTVTVNSGELDFSNSTGSAVAIAGTKAAGLNLPTSVAAATTGASTPGTAASTGVNAAVTVAGTASPVTLAAGDLSIKIGNGQAVSITGTFKTGADLANEINSRVSGAFASFDSTTSHKLSIESAQDVTMAGTKALTGTNTMGFTATNAASGNLSTINVKSTDSANDAIVRVDSALNAVNNLRGTFGAIQNRFESVISNLSSTSENLSAARSRIQDADFASETASMTRGQILQQAGTAMLAQANSLPNGVLALLR